MTIEKLTQIQIEKVVKVLYQARTDAQVKLRFGARKRDKLAAALKSGLDIDVTDCRYKWLKESRDVLIDALGQQALKFNLANKHDMCSVKDLIDVLHSTLQLLKAKEAEPLKDDKQP